MKIIIDKTTVEKPPFFFLHIRKSGGETAKSLLSPYYVNLNTPKKNPPSFLQIDTKDWNALINTPKVNLGEYNYKRCLFAREFLYKEDWDSIFSFAFSREPVDRVVSMFYYLFIKNNTQVITIARELFKNKRLYLSTSSKFDLFLDWIEKTHLANDIHIVDRVVATHTAPMSGDIFDENDNILLTKIYRIENLYSSIDDIYKHCNLVKNSQTTETEKKIRRFYFKKNVNKKRKDYRPNQNQLKRIQEIYSKDFNIYENAL